MSCLLVRSKWSQIVKCLSTGTTLILPLSRSAFVNLFFVAFEICIANKWLVALFTLVLFFVGMCLFMASQVVHTSENFFTRLTCMRSTFGRRYVFIILKHQMNRILTTLTSERNKVLTKTLTCAARFLPMPLWTWLEEGSWKSVME